MITLIQGKESYQRKRELDAILERNQDAKISFFKDEVVIQNSIFKEKRLFVIFGLSERKDILKRLNKVEDIEAVFIEEEIIKKKSLLDLIDKVVTVEPIKDLERWIKSYNREIEPPAVKLLSIIVGNDLWALSNEIDKLSLYKKGGKITKDDVALLVKPRVEIGVFDAINALAQRERKEALRFIYAQIENGEPILSILARISTQFRTLLLVKNDPGTAKELGLHPYYFQKVSEQARKFSHQELKKIYEKIFLIESSIKTGKIESDLALNLLIFDL